MSQNLKTIIAGRGDKYINLVDMLSTIDMLQTTSSNKSTLKAIFTGVGDKYITITTMTAFLNSLEQLSLCSSSEVNAAKSVLSDIGNKIVTLPTAESMFDALPSLSGDDPTPPTPPTVYDYYIGWSNVTDDTAFAALSDTAIKANTIGYNKSANPSYTGSFDDNKKVIYVLYKSDSAPVSALLDGPALDTPFTAEDIQDIDSWFYRHSAVVIDDVSYTCVGYGDVDLSSAYQMTINFVQ